MTATSRTQVTSSLKFTNFVTSANEIMFSHVSVCLFINGITQKLLIKFFFMKFHGMVGHKPGTNRLDFRGDREPDPDPGIIEGIFNTAVLTMVKAPRRGFVSRPKIRRLADLKLNKL